MMSRIVLILLFLIGAPSAAMAQAAPKKAETRKSIGVISTIGSTFALEKIGFTAFQNDYKEAAIDAWGIDDAVVAKTAVMLGNRHDVRKVTYSKSAFTDYEKPGGLFRDREEELRTVIRGIVAAAPQKSDLYLIVLRASANFSGTNQTLMGLGLVEASNPFVATYNLHALSSLRIYDGRTLALVAQKTATLGQGPLFTVTSGPHRTVDKSWWPASTNLANNERLRNATRTLVEQSLTITLPELMRVN